MMVFLRINQITLEPSPGQATEIILSLAAGEVSEENFARWSKDNWPA